MFTPSEIREKVFKTGIGYDRKDVEQFLNELASDYEALQQENLDSQKKFKDLTDSISYYKSIEKTLQKALFLAEKTAQETKASALREAELIEREATIKAKNIIANSNKQKELLEHKILNLLEQYDFFKIHFKNLLNAQSELLDGANFSFQTEGFSYQEEPEERIKTKKVQGDSSEDIDAANSEASDSNNQDQIIFDFMKEQPDSKNYQTEDGFEFITLKEE